MAGSRPVAPGGAAQRVQEGELAAAGEFGQLLAVQPVPAEQVEYGGGLVLEGEEFAAEVFAGVDAGGPQPVGDLGGFGVPGEAGYAVGGQQQGAPAAAGGGQRGRRRDGGTAGAAGAGDEDRTHPGQTFGTDSTRFFSPARARSMMTFSALRLIMPSIGILTSTVSR